MTTRLRSPRYPSMSLEDAIAHGNTIFDKDRRHPIAREVAATHIGYKSLNGAADSALSSLMQYGILEKVNKGEVRVSQWTVDILHPDNPNQRSNAIRSAGQNPVLFRALNERFAETIPSNETLRSYLTRENFNDRAIAPVIAAYVKTRAFVAQECANDSSIPRPDLGTDLGSSEGEDGEHQAVERASIGDLIDWEVNGAIGNPEPMRVIGLSNDLAWVFVNESKSGIPMDQVVVKERGAIPPVALTIMPPANPFSALTPQVAKQMEETRPSNDSFRSEKFDADEGVIAISWPSNLSPQSVDDMKAWIELLMKRISRRANASAGGTEYGL
jgi:hypothetical protein